MSEFVIGMIACLITAAFAIPVGVILSKWGKEMSEDGDNEENN